MNVEAAFGSADGGGDQIEAVGFDGDCFEARNGKQLLFGHERKAFVGVERRAFLIPNGIAFDDADDFKQVGQFPQSGHFGLSVVVPDAQLTDFDAFHIAVLLWVATQI